MAVWPALAMAFCQPSAAAAAPTGTPWGEYVEAGFPFISAVIDGRSAEGFADNLTPRALVLRLDAESWVGFDVDLLRVAVVWQGPGLSPVSMSQGSYHTSGIKAPEGQRTLPVPLGTRWLENAILPGWSCGEEPLLADPREPGPDPREVGRGPLPSAIARFRAVRIEEENAILEYEVAGSAVQETWYRPGPGSFHEPGSLFSPSLSTIPHGGDSARLVRRLQCGPCQRTRWLIVGRPRTDLQVSVELHPGDAAPLLRLSTLTNGILAVRISPSSVPVSFALLLTAPRKAHHGARGEPTPVEGRSLPLQNDTARTVAPSPPLSAHGLDRGDRPPRRWLSPVATTIRPGSAAHAYAVDNVELPLANPWRRNVRTADVGFFPDGRAAVVTFDGDVWWIDGLSGGGGIARWRRFASGLHEPLSLVVEQGAVVVFDRNGLWRLLDTDGNGEADRHELISNAFTQTAETREFATALRLAPDGSYVLSKGGQQTSTLGRHNGTVLRVPADGAPAAVLAYGLRMPFIGVHPGAGIVTASDQQGHYVPATPLHLIRDHQFYGFISLLLPKERYPAPIAEPLTWIPHAVNASGAGQTWWIDARAGALDGALIHLGYYRPELFVVRLHTNRVTRHAAVMSLTRDLAFPPLHAAVNPADGLLYVAGFQIWGSEARQIAGLARVRPTGKTFTLPRAVLPMRQGVLLQFDTPLESASAAQAGNYAAERWNYRRSAGYGSPHYRLDGSKGQEALPPSSAYLSSDGRSVFVGIPDMRPAMQMRLGWTVQLADGTSSHHNAYFTPAELPEFEPAHHGFSALTVDLTQRRTIQQAAADPPTPAEGRRIAELMGCTACHSTDGSTLGKVGPSWQGLYGSERTFADGTRSRANEDYLRESIREPAARIVAGFNTSDTGMPSYDGVLTEAQIESLIAYLRTVE